MILIKLFTISCGVRKMYYARGAYYSKKFVDKWGFQNDIKSLGFLSFLISWLLE